MFRGQSIHWLDTPVLDVVHEEQRFLLFKRRFIERRFRRRFAKEQAPKEWAGRSLWLGGLGFYTINAISKSTPSSYGPTAEFHGSVFTTEKDQIMSNFSISLGCVPSIHHQSGALHITTHRRGKENDGIRHLLDHAQSLERCPFEVSAQV